MKDTSLSAYREIMATGRARTLRERVFLYISQHPSCTQLDVSLDCGESARKRIHELLGPEPEHSPVFEGPGKEINGRKYTTYFINPCFKPKTHIENLPLFREAVYTSYPFCN